MKKNGVVHFEIYARDAEKLAKFYSTLFDWTIEAMPGMDYHYVKTVDTDDKGMPTQPGGINGGLVVRPAGFEDPGWINYINVESLDPAVKRAQDLGANVMKPRAAVPGMGWFAMLVDPQGNSFAMWERDPNAKRKHAMQLKQKIAPCLWFDNQGEEAAPPAGGLGHDRRVRARRPALHGAQRRPDLQVQRSDLVLGAVRHAAGDRLVLAEAVRGRRPEGARELSDPDPEKSGRLMEAMLKMKKIDIATLERAYGGHESRK